MTVVELWNHEYHKIVNHMAGINRKWLELRKKSFGRAAHILEIYKKRNKRTRSVAFRDELMNEYRYLIHHKFSIRQKGRITRSVSEFFPSGRKKRKRILSFDKLFNDESSCPEEKKFKKKNGKNDFMSTQEWSMKQKKPSMRRIGTMVTPFKFQNKISRKKLFKCRTFVRPESKTQRKERKTLNKFFVPNSNREKKKDKIGRLKLRKLNKEDNKIMINKFDRLIKSASNMKREIKEQAKLKKKEEKNKIEEKRLRKEFKIKSRRAVKLMGDYQLDYQIKFEKFKNRMRLNHEKWVPIWEDHSEKNSWIFGNNTSTSQMLSSKQSNKSNAGDSCNKQTKFL